MRRLIIDENAPRPSGSYSPAIMARGTFIFTAGQIGKDPKTGTLPDGIEAQTRQAIENLRSILQAAGCNLKDVVRMLVFLADLKDGNQFNSVYSSYFSEIPPVRTRVQAGALAPNILVEMEAIAVIPEDD